MEWILFCVKNCRLTWNYIVIELIILKALGNMEWISFHMKSWKTINHKIIDLILYSKWHVINLKLHLVANLYENENVHINMCIILKIFLRFYLLKNNYIKEECLNNLIFIMYTIKSCVHCTCIMYLSIYRLLVSNFKVKHDV